MASGATTLTATWTTSAKYPQHSTNKLTKITVNGKDYKLRPGMTITQKLLSDILAASGA